VFEFYLVIKNYNKIYSVLFNFYKKKSITTIKNNGGSNYHPGCSDGVVAKKQQRRKGQGKICSWTLFNGGIC
jgi:hypothetical protein